MANGGIQPNDSNKHKPENLEFEDYGTPTMYLFGILSIITMVACIVLFIGLVVGGTIAILEIVNGY